MVITDSASQDSGLQELVLSGVKEFNIESLAAAIATKDCSLGSLSIRFNQIGGAGAEALAASISKQDCSWKSLDLNGNSVGDAGAEALAAAISKQDCSLKALYLNGNSVGDAGAESCFEMAAASALAILFQVRFNRSNEQSCFDMAAARACSLRELTLQECKIADEGAMAFAKSIAKEEFRLELLDLSNFFIFPEHHNRLSSASKAELRAKAKPTLKLVLPTKDYD